MTRSAILVHMDIESGANERIKRLVRLHKRRHRVAEGVFVVEGDEIEAALASGLTPTEVYRPETKGTEIPAEQTFVCSGRALRKASYRSDPAAVIAVFPGFATALDDLRYDDPALVIIAENLEKPGNLGAILRTSAAAGVDAVVATGDIDPFNPNVIRASRGAVFSVQLTLADIRSALDWSRSVGLQVVAAVPQAGKPPWSIDLVVATALVVGAEATGLTPGTIEAADITVTIPMNDRVDSLNVSAATAMLAYEVLRQRAG